MNGEFIGLWMGRDISTLSRDELLEVIRFLAKETESLRGDRDRLFAAVDPVKYLMQQGPGK